MQIKITKHFQRSFKKYQRKHYQMDDVYKCVEAIARQDKLFLQRHKDHAIGSVYRELHINRQANDDWLLVYRFDEASNQLILILVELGNHKELNRIDYFEG